MKMLKSADYAKIVSAKKIKGSGLTVGETVLIVAQQTVPVKKSDPYVFRVLFTVVKLEDGMPLLPADDNDHMAYMVDPRSLEWVGKDKQIELEQLLNTRY